MPPAASPIVRGFHAFTSAMNMISSITAGITAVLGAGAMVLLLPWWHDDANQDTTLQITAPSGTIVEPLVSVHGTVHNLPSGQSVWLNIVDLDNLRNNPQDQPCQVTDDTFQCAKAYVGDPKQHNHGFRIQIWLVGAEQISTIQEYNQKAHATHRYTGMDSLPDGTIAKASHDVVRR